MASSSSSSSRPRTWRYRVFTSFHGPDVRKTFLSHLRKEFNNNGISMFDDQGIERGQTIAPELRRAIRESRISIVVLSEYYASSSWCLDELVEILKCKKDKNQIVMTIFYGGVDPSDVRKQTGDFGKVFKKTCARKTEEERRKWSQALNRAGKIAGEHFLNWLYDQKVLIILDDVDDLQQLEALANDTNWFVISAERTIVMHKLLHQVCRQAIQSQEPWKRQILVDTDKILHVFKKDSGNRSVMGISFDISTIKDSMDISPKALKRMCNLQFLRIYNTIRDTNVIHVPENMDFPPRLKLLHWEEYPGTCLPHTLRPEHLVELNLEDSKLKHLWEGTQPLGNLKKLNLSWSSNLEELPDLGNATNLEILDVCKCQSLVEIHSSVGNLHKLERLEMGYCGKLQVIPSLFNLTSLETVGIAVCDQLRKLPDISATITELSIVDTILQEFTASVRRWSRLQTLLIGGSVIPNQFMIERSGADIERIPDCIKDLHRLENLYIVGCPKLVSLPELPTSLKRLIVWKCESLAEILVSFPSDSKIEDLCFPDCVKLGPEARRVITQLQSSRVCLPGKTIPAEFNHRADGNSLAICSNAFGGFKMCVIVSPKTGMEYANDIIELICRILINGCPMENCIFPFVFTIQSEHLFIFHSEIRRGDRRLDQYSEILFEFSASSQDIKIVECGVQI
ncbi:unnamed protein product [Brassica rapa subsp. narinosa]